MPNYVTLSTIGMREPDFSHLPKNLSVYEKEMKVWMKKRIDEVLPDNPDLIVFRECANRYFPSTRQELKEYYRYLGNSMEEYLGAIAADNHTNMAYSAVRYTGVEEEKPFRNSTVYIDRGGNVCGIYDKNHLVIEENTEVDVKYGTQAPLIKLDFGTVASAICFDLNFDELLDQYKRQKPDLIVFCSNYHGGLMRQAHWAYTCRSYFVSAVCDSPSNIINPFGDIIASSTNYTKHTSARINLDYALCHLDYNRRKIADAKNKYKNGLTVYDPGFVGSVMLTCEVLGKTVWDILAEFEIEPLDVYLERARTHRLQNL